MFTGNLVTAAFTHDASRALDAQLHTHLVCANATYDHSAGKWYALQNREMFKAAELAGRIYQNALARRAIDLGYDIRVSTKDGKIQGFEIVGVTERDLEVQSTRRKQIEEEIETFEIKHGRPPTTGERHVMATSTRSSKLSEVTTEEVRAGQLARHGAEDQARLSGLVRDARMRATERPQNAYSNDVRAHSVRETIERAIQHLAERSSVFDSRAVLAHVLREVPGVADYHAVRGVLEEIKRHLVVTLGNEDARSAVAPIEARLLTTAENLRLESEAVRMVEDGKKEFMPLATDYHLNPELAPDQRAAVEGILNSRDQFQVLRGPAGTGKTTTLSSLDRVVREVAQHTNAIYVAPTHQAKGVLKRDGFKDATTIARLLVEIESRKRDLRGKLLVVDESGMISTRDGHILQSAIQKAGARCLWVGDHKQLPAVTAGDFMAILINHARIQLWELKTIFRQRENPEYLRAMEVMATGDVKSALGILDEQGWVKESGGEYLQQAAEAYCERVNATDNTKLGLASNVALIASTWREIEAMTSTVRRHRKARGKLIGPEVLREVIDALDITDAERRSDSSYRPGMFVSPAKRAFGGLQKNEWCEVRSVDAGILTLTNGIKIPLHKAGDRLLLGEQRQLPLQAGDRILLQGNDAARGLTNGMLGFVTTVRADGTIKFREIAQGKLSKRELTIEPSYKTFTHGYAMTVHRAQGEGIMEVICAIGRAISGALWNVLTSRGRKRVQLFVSDKKSTIERAPSSIENRPAALDFFSITMNQEHPRSKIPVAKSLFEDRAADGGLTNTEPLPEPHKIEDEPPPLGDNGHKLSEPTTVAEILARVAAKQFGNAAALPELRAKIPEGNSAPLPEKQPTVPKEHMQKLSAAAVAARFKVPPILAPLFRRLVTPQRGKGQSLGEK